MNKVRILLDGGTDDYGRARFWSREETAERIAAGPPVQFPKPDQPAIARLVADYEALTGEVVRTPGKRKLLVNSYRVHGPTFLEVVAAQLGESGSPNLLGLVHCTWPGSGPFARGVYVQPDAIDAAWTAEDLAAIDVSDPSAEPDWVARDIDQQYTEPIDLMAAARRIFADDLAEEVR